MIYFARSGNAVKIGTAINVKKRLDQFKAGCPTPLTSVYVMDGGPTEEQQIHRRFRALHQHGEWFRIDNELAAFITKNTTPMPFNDKRSRATTGRSELFGFRCRAGLKEACQSIAQERGIPLAQWLEEVLDRAIMEDLTGEKP